jgi:hypothetical protein
MNNLKLPNPKMMDVAVAANMHADFHQDKIARKGWAPRCCMQRQQPRDSSCCLGRYPRK